MYVLYTFVIVMALFQFLIGILSIMSYARIM